MAVLLIDYCPTQQSRRQGRTGMTPSETSLHGRRTHAVAIELASSKQAGRPRRMAARPSRVECCRALDWLRGRRGPMRTHNA